MASRDQLLQQRTGPIFRVSELVVKDLHHREQHIVSSDPEHNQFISAQRSPSVDVRRVEMSLARIREWMRANPQSAEEVLRQNRSFVFFRIVGLSGDREPKDARDASHDREAVGAQGVPLTPGRSIAVDNALHVYGTPFFIQADLPLTGEMQSVSFDRLIIAQDIGSASASRYLLGRRGSSRPARWSCQSSRQFRPAGAPWTRSGHSRSADAPAARKANIYCTSKSGWS
jgi:hypothetical protein